MKTLKTSLFTLTLCFSTLLSKAQLVTIPDANFVTWLTANVPTAMSGNQMDTTDVAVTTTTHIMHVSHLNISDLTGVQYFSSLTDLFCDSNYYLGVLPRLPNSLKKLSCVYSSMSSLPALPNSITYIDCSINAIATLPTLPTSLLYLECSNGGLLTLPALPNLLTYLDCNSNGLLTLPTLPNSLKKIDCSNNNFLYNIPALPSSLTYLNCDADSISSLPALPALLDTLICSGTYGNLTSLPALPNSLRYLDCSYDSLTSLPVLPNSLVYLDCISNKLTSLPVLPNALKIFGCDYNMISCFPTFPNGLTYLDVYGNPFNCLPNYVAAMSSTLLAYPICAAGNSNGCPAPGTTAIKQNEADVALKVYPNPASNVVTVELGSENEELQVFDILGNEVIRLLLPYSKYDIDISSLQAGVYFMKTQNAYLKIIKGQK